MSQTITRTFSEMATQAKLRQQETDSAAQTTEVFFNADADKLAQLQEEMERRSREASAKLARLQEKLDAMTKEKEEKEREAHVQKERTQKIAQVLYNTLGDVNSAFNFTHGDGQKAVEGIVGQKKASEVGKLIGDTFEDSMPAIDAWASETVGGVKAYLAKRGETAVSIAKLQRELDELRKRLAEKQDELARLLLTIDELRLRLSKVRHAPAATDTFQEIGLEEFIDDLGPTQLRGVFERLYEDAVQRISRSNLVLHHLMTGKQAFAKLAQDQEIGFTAALQQLNETVSATLKGMWYNSEYVFRHVCQYAIEKGAEQSLACKDNKGSVTDFLQEELIGEEDALALGWQQRPQNRLPGRRGEQRPSGANSLRTAYPGTLGGAGKTLWHPMPGGVNPPDISPRQTRKKHLANPESNPFTEYVASLREARGEAPTAGGTPPLMRMADDVEWHRSDVRAAKSEGANALPNITFINRPADLGGGKPRSDMGKSASLPALPTRGRLGGSY
jgi:molecular chaperone GrpE (heat shock protein)